MLNLDQLIAIEDQAARACAGWLRRQAAEIRADLPSLEGELLAHAQALLVKLEHLERSDRPASIPNGEPDYLCPTLTLPGMPFSAVA